MERLTAGRIAPSFRLPSAQGPEVGLDDFRGKKRVVVWFTKGMACIFCRQHMSQLARAYSRFQALDAEVLEITPTPPERARFYAKKYALPFPYLCDPQDQVKRAWSLEVRRRSPLWYAKGMFLGMTCPKPDNDFGMEPPAPGELALLLRDEDAGLYIVDREGVIRFAYADTYLTLDSAKNPVRPIPSNEEIVRELERAPHSGA